MAMEMRQQLKMNQQLVMTPQLQQAIKLLQLTRLELQDLVQQELEENPLLEENSEAEVYQDTDGGDLEEKESAVNELSETLSDVVIGESSVVDRNQTEELSSLTEECWYDTGWYPDGHSRKGDPFGEDDDQSQTDRIPAPNATLASHLLWQLHMGQYSEMDVRVGEVIIGNLDEAGYLRATLSEIAAASNSTEEDVLDVLDCIQEFDPPGVAARDLRECLLIQARFMGMKGSPVEGILLKHLSDLEKRNYKVIARSLGVDINQVLISAKIIAGFDPRPGSSFNSDDVHYISADIFVHKIGDDYVVLLNDDGLPNLKVSTQYSEVRGSGSIDSRTEDYIGDKMRSAQWLIKSIQQRQRTIYKVAKSIIRFQREYFDRGIEYLRPLVLRDIAEDIGMHESTISRVTTNKYMQTPQGLFELKYFFNSGLSTSEGESVASESVKNRIREIIGHENIKKPLSDQKIAELLAAEGVIIARRTVTKYREMLRFGAASERKRHF